jgi:hypothetical protein
MAIPGDECACHAQVGELFDHFQRDALALNSAFSEILKYSLLRRDPNASTLN